MEALDLALQDHHGETKIPAGEIYQAVEGANGELGFYPISDGGRNRIACISVVLVLFITRHTRNWTKTPCSVMLLL